MTTPNGGMPPPIDDELLSAWLDGRVSPAERDAVDAAMAADPAARARAADLRATVALLRGLPQPAPRRTFILTPEQAATIRPARGAWLARLFPTVAAVGAVAAVLCLALIAGDLATGGFSTKKQVTTARPAIESVANATATGATVAAAPAATTAAAAPTSAALAPAAVAANVSASAPAGSAVSARSAAIPAGGAAVIAPSVAGGAVVAVPPLTPTAGPFAASNGSLPATPTLVANVQAPPAANVAPPGGATVAKETHRVPLALVRAGEILLGLLAVVGLGVAALNWAA